VGNGSGKVRKLHEEVPANHLFPFERPRRRRSDNFKTDQRKIRLRVEDRWKWLRIVPKGDIRHSLIELSDKN
jgi:hypothetical protein